MNHKIPLAIEKYKMLENTESVLAAVSGGPDSMAMLHWLNFHAKEYGYTLYAVHLNHCLRGEESDRDENLVRTVCKEYGIRLFCERRDIEAIAKEKKLGIEVAARNERYELFKSIAERLPSCRIATAHTASDNAETVLLNLTRGSGLSGLCGIPAVRDNIIRPILQCSRNDVLDYCHQYSVKYFIDSSNLTDEYSRNQIRHNVIPNLVRLNPSFFDAVTRMTDSLNEDADYLESAAKVLTDTDNSIDIKGIKEAHLAVAKKAIRLAYKNLTGYMNLEKGHVDLILDMLRSDSLSGEGLSIPHGIQVISDNGKLRFVFPADKQAEKPWRQAMVIGRNILPDGKVITAGVFDKSSFDLTKLSHKNSAILDYDKTGRDIIIRARIEGDYYHPDKRKGGRSLKKLFIDAKIPREERWKTPVFESNGVIFYVLGFEPDRSFLANENTTKILYISLE